MKSMNDKPGSEITVAIVKCMRCKCKQTRVDEYLSPFGFSCVACKHGKYDIVEMIKLDNACRTIPNNK